VPLPAPKPFVFEEKRRKLPIERVSSETHSAPVFCQRIEKEISLLLPTSPDHPLFPSFLPFFFAVKREKEKKFNHERKKKYRSSSHTRPIFVSRDWGERSSVPSLFHSVFFSVQLNEKIEFPRDLHP
jgi:hypothetical protein